MPAAPGSGPKAALARGEPHRGGRGVRRPLPVAAAAEAGGPSPIEEGDVDFAIHLFELGLPADRVEAEVLARGTGAAEPPAELPRWVDAAAGAGSEPLSLQEASEWWREAALNFHRHVSRLRDCVDSCLDLDGPPVKRRRGPGPTEQALPCQALKAALPLAAAQLGWTRQQGKSLLDKAGRRPATPQTQRRQPRTSGESLLPPPGVAGEVAAKARDTDASGQAPSQLRPLASASALASAENSEPTRELAENSEPTRESGSLDAVWAPCVGNQGSPISSSAAPKGSTASDLERQSDEKTSVGEAICASASSMPDAPQGPQLNAAGPQICALCCEDAPPGSAARLACGCGRCCRGCLGRWVEARLKAGAVDVPCPAACGADVPEHDLRRLVSGDLVERVLRRGLELAVAASAELRACPTPGCPMRVALDDAAGRGGVRLRCRTCRKESCARCGAQPSHRGRSCAEHASALRRVRRKRGEQEAVEGLVRWMKETGTQQCPTCSMAVSKQHLQGQSKQHSECHKMMCRNCGTKFCFKCLRAFTENMCGCSIGRHGFINPHTGRRVGHLQAISARKPPKAPARVAAKAAAPGSARPRGRPRAS